jgi:hypothetical protein
MKNVSDIAARTTSAPAIPTISGLFTLPSPFFVQPVCRT